MESRLIYISLVNDKKNILTYCFIPEFSLLHVRMLCPSEGP
jgi:hypothetical protein